MSLVRCYDDDGQAHLVVAESLRFSPAVYGIFIENKARVLLLNQPHSGLYAPPGLLLPKREAPTQAIRHYFQRLASFSPLLGALLLVEEQYRWLGGQGWRVAALYYGIQRPFSASIHLQPDAATGAAPEWVDLLEVQRQRFQFGFRAISAGIAWAQAQS